MKLLNILLLFAAVGCISDSKTPDSNTGRDAGRDGPTENNVVDQDDLQNANNETDATRNSDERFDDVSPDPNPGSVRFFGFGGLRGDRILIRIDDETDNDPGPPIDIGAGDFTIEFWMKARAIDNVNGAISCGPTNDWVTSNIIIDRDRHSQAPSYGIGIADQRIVWAVQNENSSSYSNCGQTVVTDGQWHHVAVGWRAGDGEMWIWVDGDLDFTGEGPPGNISYPDDGVPLNVCPDGLCSYSDPFISFGAEKHGYADISYSGFLDEVRFSTGLRYTDPFTRPRARFERDSSTVGLYHFDEGEGTTTADDSGVSDLQDGEFILGGIPTGPVWSEESPF